MSQHKTNPQAVLRAMLPELLPHGFANLIQLVLEVVPAAGVLPYPAQAIRTNTDGKVEILQRIEHAVVEDVSIEAGLRIAKVTDKVETLEVWEAPPQGVRHVHPIGQPFPPELCDVVLMFGTSVQDGLQGGLVTAGGQPARYPTSHLMHGELMRMPLVEWQKAHMVQLRGQVVI